LTGGLWVFLKNGLSPIKPSSAPPVQDLALFSIEQLCPILRVPQQNAKGCWLTTLLEPRAKYGYMGVICATFQDVSIGNISTSRPRGTITRERGARKNLYWHPFLSLKITGGWLEKRPGHLVWDDRVVVYHWRKPKCPHTPKCVFTPLLSVW
jgi:hypothetical protein